MTGSDIARGPPSARRHATYVKSPPGGLDPREGVVAAALLDLQAGDADVPLVATSCSSASTWTCTSDSRSRACRSDNRDAAAAHAVEQLGGPLLDDRVLQVELGVEADVGAAGGGQAQRLRRRRVGVGAVEERLDARPTPSPPSVPPRSSSLTLPCVVEHQLRPRGRPTARRCRSCRRPVEGTSTLPGGRRRRRRASSRWLSKSYRAPASPLTLTSKARRSRSTSPSRRSSPSKLRALVAVVAEVADDVVDGVGHQPAGPGEDATGRRRASASRTARRRTPRPRPASRTRSSGRRRRRSRRGPWRPCCRGWRRSPRRGRGRRGTCRRPARRSRHCPRRRGGPRRCSARPSSLSSVELISRSLRTESM